MKGPGTRSFLSPLGLLRVGDLMPRSFSSTAALTSRIRTWSPGSCDRDVMRPNCPMAFPSPRGSRAIRSRSSASFQNPKTQCSLNAAMPQTIPL